MTEPPTPVHAPYLLPLNLPRTEAMSRAFAEPYPRVRSIKHINTLNRRVSPTTIRPCVKPRIFQVESQGRGYKWILSPCLTLIPPRTRTIRAAVTPDSIYRLARPIPFHDPIDNDSFRR
jgi:hypothetical protein